MKNQGKKIAAALSAIVLGTMSLAGSVTANAAARNEGFYYGDVTKDGVVSAEDAQTVFNWANSKKKLTADEKKRADVNGDGKVTDDDAFMILDFYTNMLVGTALLGDVDGNGKIGYVDWYTLDLYMRGYDEEVNLIAGDVNKDGKINMTDIRSIKAMTLNN